MRKIAKNDMLLTINNKNSVSVTSTFDGFAQLIMYLTFFALFIGMISLSFALTNSKNTSLVTFAIIGLTLFVAATISLVAIATYFKKNPNIVFIGDKAYIKADKEFYLELSPDDLENYNLYATSFSGHKMLNHEIYYSSCSHWGKAELTCQGEKYRLNCDSLAKAKHYLDGFKNNTSVEENPFEGDFLQKYFKTSILMCIPFFFGLLMIVQSFIIESLKLWWLELIIGCAVVLASIIVIINYVVKNHKRHKEESLNAFKAFVYSQPIEPRLKQK